MSNLDTDVIKFPVGVSRKEFARKSRASKSHTPEERAPEAELLSVTAGNGRLRMERRDAFRTAEAATRYWRLRIDFEDAVSLAQRMEIPEGDCNPVVDPDHRRHLVDRYRKALVGQLLTPAVGCCFSDLETSGAGPQRLCYRAIRQGRAT